jgi:hypothetical protein
MSTDNVYVVYWADFDRGYTDHVEPEIVGVYTEEKQALKLYNLYKNREIFFENPNFGRAWMTKIEMNKHNKNPCIDELYWDDIDENENEEEDENQKYQRYINKLLELKHKIEIDDANEYDNFEKYTKLLSSLLNQFNVKLHKDNDDYVKLKVFARSIGYKKLDLN